MRNIFNHIVRRSSSMRGGLLISLLGILSSIIVGQTTVTTGTTMTVMPGSTVVSLDHVTLQNGSTLNNQGTVVLKKDLNNQNTGENPIGTGNIELSGSSTFSQVITGQNVIQNLSINSSAGVSLAGNTKVNGVFTLTNGLTSLGNYNLLLGAAATVSGSPSNTNMVVTTGSGLLQKIFTATGSFTFPVGDATATAEYSPVTLAFSSGTFGAAAYAGVNLVDAQYPATATSYLTRYWKVAQTGISGFACNATFQYLPADVVGTESDIFSFKVDPALPWIAYNKSDEGLHQLTVHGLSSFGTFTGNLGNGSVPPAIRSLQDKTSFIAGTVYCTDALQTMLIAGNGTSYIVPNGGNVSQIAGQNIIYYPGTTVIQGGYMHGFISNTFCNPYNHPAAATVVAGNEDQGDPLKTDNSFFKIYPNPTPGKFTLEIKGDATTSQVHVAIFGILGDRVLSNDLLLERKQEFSLIDRPAGVYVIHVTSGVNSRSEKIIKQ